MSTLTSALSPSSETSRLHRWAMWRMNVNEGIITCIREQGTSRVLYPVDGDGIAGPTLGDNHSLRSGSVVTSAGDPTRPFLLISPEQMSLARTMNLRDKYGSGYRLSEDTYFIFGIPRISTYGKEIPEVKSQTGTQSLYSSSVDLRPITVHPGAFQSNQNNSHFRVSDLLLMSLEKNSGREKDSTAHYQQGPTPERRPQTTHPGTDYRGDSGVVDGLPLQAQWSFKPGPRSNLYSIHEDAEFVSSNNDDFSNNNRSYQPERNFTHVSVPPTSTAFKEYDFNRLNNNLSDNATRLHSAHGSNTERSLRNSYSESPMDGTVLSPPTRFNKGPAPQVRPKPQSHLHPAVDGNQHGLTSQDVYPPFSPTRSGYSAATSWHRHNPAPFTNGPAHPGKTSYNPFPSHRPSSRSPPPDRMGGSASSPPAPGQAILRPTGFLWDNAPERWESKARYDWSSPTTERDVVSDFSHYSRLI